MTRTANVEQRTQEPNPSRAVDLDYPTLGRLVESEAQDLVDGAETVNSVLQALVRNAGSAGESSGAGRVNAHSLDELIAGLNAIGARAYRLARHVRTLVEFREVQLGHQLHIEASQ